MKHIIKKKKKNDELMHYGVKGMKWGVRRYQNPDGSLTAKGKERMIKSLAKEKLSNRTTQHLINSTIMNEDIKRVSEAKKKYLDSKRSEYLYAYEKQVGSVVDKLVGKHIYMDYADTPTAIKARTNGEKFVKNYIEKQARDLKELEALESFELDEIELYERQNFR